MTPIRILSSSILLLAVSATATAQTWTQVLPAPYPTTLARRQGALEFDPIQNKLLMYGGVQQSPALALNDTWTFDGTTWTQLAPATTPPPRWGHKMVYDSVRGRIVTFGGRSPTLTANANDTWEWDGFDWAQVVTANAPSVRAFYGMAFDQRRGKTVLYGGGLAGVVTGGNQTWEYDGVNWTAVVTPLAIPGLESPAMVYDKGRGVVVMFGGWTGSIDYRTTWEYDGTNWVVHPTVNAPLTGYRTGMVYDDLRGRVVLYGGYSGGQMQNKTWEYDGNDWTNVLVGGSPGRITEAYMAYSPAIGSAVYFGGSGPPVTGTVNNETWLYAGVTTAIAAKFGQGCATSAGVPDLTPTTTPVLGSNYVLDVTNGAITGVGIAAHGFSNTSSLFGSLPMNLSTFGFTGCRLEVSTDATTLLLVNAGSATQTLSFPNDPNFAGLPLFSQVLVLDSTAPNGNGGMSNAVHAVLGS